LLMEDIYRPNALPVIQPTASYAAIV